MFDVVGFRLQHGLNPDGGPTANQREVAHVLHWSVKRVRRWTVAGRLPHDREHEGAWPVYPLPALAAWLEQRDRSAA